MACFYVVKINEIRLVLKLNLQLILIFYLFCSIACKKIVVEKPQDLSRDTTLSIPTQQWTKLLNKNPNNTSYLLERAKSLVNNDQLIGLAVRDFQFLHKKEPKNSEFALSYVKLLFDNKEVKESMQVLNDYTKLNPKDVEALFLQGKYHYYLTEFEDAILYLNRALNLKGTHVESMFFLANSYRDMRDTGQALSLYKKIVEVDPAHYNSVVQIANLYASQKNPDAVDYYNMALRLNEFGLDALYGRAYFYQQMGYLEEAVKDYQQIVEINPTHTQSIYNIAYLNFKKKSWKVMERIVTIVEPSNVLYRSEQSSATYTNVRGTPASLLTCIHPVL